MADSKKETKKEAKPEPKVEDTKEDEDEIKMEFRKLGNTGLLVSCLGFGFMTIDSVKQAKELLKACRPNENGINFFDNAEVYGEPCGNAERIFGKALKELQKENKKLWRRSELVITTKLFWGVGNGKNENSPTTLFGSAAGHGPNETGLSRKHLMEGMISALERLDLEYVDIVYAHRHSAHVSTLEVVRGFTDIINKGYALYWGTSTWPMHKVLEAYWLAKVHKLIPPVVEQPLYNMNSRQYIDRLYLPLFEEPYNIATTVWSPLDGGYLTGKYIKGVAKGSRLDASKEGGNRLSKFYAMGGVNKEKVEKSKKLKEFVDKELKGETLVSLALAWCLKNKNVTVLLLGGRKAEQITQNLRSVNLAKKMDKSMMEKIEKVLDNKPAKDYTRSTVTNSYAKKHIETWN